MCVCVCVCVCPRHPPRMVLVHICMFLCVFRTPQEWYLYMHVCIMFVCMSSVHSQACHAEKKAEIFI